MKRILYILPAVLLLISAAAQAQDIIVRKNAEEIEAKVLEISDNQIRYKRSSNPEGPTYTIAVSDVFIVKYQNGEKDVFGGTDAVATAPAALLQQRTIAAGQPLRAKATRFGVRGDFGISAVSYAGGGMSESSNGTYFGAMVFADRFIQPDATLFFGGALGFSQAMYSEEVMGTKSESTVDFVSLDLYLGREAIFGKAFSVKAGMRVLMPVSAEGGVSGGTKQDFLESCSPVQIGLLVNPYWQVKKVGIGIDMGFMMTNFLKKEGYYEDLSSNYVSLGVHLNYHF